MTLLIFNTSYFSCSHRHTHKTNNKVTVAKEEKEQGGVGINLSCYPEDNKIRKLALNKKEMFQ